MIIDQVEVKIKYDFSAEYLSWLKPHMEIMMTFQGFLKAELCKEVDCDDKESESFTDIYHVSSKEDLHVYFNHHVKAMCDEGIKRFGMLAM